MIRFSEVPSIFARVFRRSSAATRSAHTEQVGSCWPRHRGMRHAKAKAHRTGRRAAPAVRAGRGGAGLVRESNPIYREDHTVSCLAPSLNPWPTTSSDIQLRLQIQFRCAVSSSKLLPSTAVGRAGRGTPLRGGGGLAGPGKTMWAGRGFVATRIPSSVRKCRSGWVRSRVRSLHASCAGGGPRQAGPIGFGPVMM